jgi:hypothetical protein
MWDGLRSAYAVGPLSYVVGQCHLNATGGGGRPSKDAVAIAAGEILDAVTHKEIAKYYQHCGYIPKDAQFDP